MEHIQGLQGILLTYVSPWKDHSQTLCDYFLTIWELGANGTFL